MAKSIADRKMNVSEDGFLTTSNNIQISGPKILDCEWCFQFDDSEPIVFATGNNDTDSSYIQFKLTNSNSSNVEFFDNNNNKKFKLFARKKMKVSFAITASREYEEIQKLIPFLLENKRVQDEIVVLYDSKNGDEKVLEFLLGFNKLPNVQTWRSDEFDNHFSDWKNKLNEYCSGDYIFQLDADELLSESLIQNIDEILELNKEIDLFYFPRINTVDGITEEHIKKWGWKMDSDNRINFPDYQGRLYRKGLNWAGKVHERIAGARFYSLIPYDDANYSIIHHKDIKRQEKQNNYYNTL